MENMIFRIDGLSGLQLEELKFELKEKGKVDALVDKSLSSLVGARHGEPDLLAAVIQIVPTVLSVVALWLAKQKGARTEKFRYKKVSRDGTLEEIDFRRSSYDEGAISASQIEAVLKEKLDGKSE